MVELLLYQKSPTKLPFETILCTVGLLSKMQFSQGSLEKCRCEVSCNNTKVVSTYLTEIDKFFFCLKVKTELYMNTLGFGIWFGLLFVCM